MVDLPANQLGPGSRAPADPFVRGLRERLLTSAVSSLRFLAMGGYFPRFALLPPPWSCGTQTSTSVPDVLPDLSLHSSEIV